jgi:hypothetical protein
LVEEKSSIFYRHKIHKLSLVHSNLYRGNILIEYNEALLDVRITDISLHGPFNIHSEEIYKVVLFVASKIFKKSKSTQASDIYS